MHTKEQTAQLNAAQRLYDRGDFSAAHQAYEQLLALQRGALPANDPALATTLYWLSMTLLELREHTPAEILVAIVGHDPLYDCDTNMRMLYGLPAARDDRTSSRDV